MSKLEKLMINGIRSFGAEDSDRQTIIFQTPLTLILGPNGTGKTTIIECLKYITTGDFPPNTKGGGFVHDPKLSNETEIKGQVTLLFKDADNKTLAAQRSLLATQKLKKLEMKTLDSSISTLLPNKEWSTISSKCVELDKEMVHRLGVSKAILNNVIFCHQEDSLWPLGEGKAVKEKFDEIFAASRYIKALDTIRKIRAAQLTDIKCIKGEISHLEHHKLTQGKKSEQLSDMETRYAASKNTIEEIEKKVKPIASKLELLGAREGEVSKLKEKLSNQETLLKRLEKNKQDYMENIQEIFEGGTEELKEEIENFSKTVIDKKRSLEEVKLNKKKFEQEFTVIRNKKDRTSVDLVALKVIEKQHKERVSQRENNILSYAVEHGITGHDKGEPVNEDEVKLFVMKLSCKSNDVEEERDKVKTEHEKKEKELNTKLEDLQDQKTRHEQTIKLSMDRKRQNDREASTIKDKLRQVDDSVLKQKDLELSLAKVEAKKTALESTVDTKALKNEIGEKQKTKDEFESKLNLLNQEMNKLQLQSQTRTELEMLTKDKDLKEEQVKKLTFRHEDTITTLLGSMPEKNIASKLETLNDTLQQDLRSSNKKLSEMKSKLSALETRRQYQSKDIKQKENFIRTKKEKIFEVAGSGDFMETLASLQENIDKLQDEKGVLAGSQVVDRKYIERIEKSITKPCCPLCERNFQEISDAEDLLSRLKRKILMIPEQLEAKEKQINEMQKQLKLMLELRPVQEELRKVTEIELPELKTKLTEYDLQIDEVKKTTNELEKSVEAVQNKTKIVSSIQPDMVLLNQHQNEQDKLNQKVTALKSKLNEQGGSGEDVRSIQDVSDEREEIQIQLQSVSKFVKDSQDKIMAYNDELQDVNEKINRQRADLLNIQSDQQKRTSLEEQRCKLVMDSKKIETDVEESKIQIEELKRQLNFIKGEREKVFKTKENEIKTFNSSIDRLLKSKDNIDQLTKLIKTYIEQGNEEKLKKSNTVLNQLDTQLQEKEKLVQERGKEIENIQRDLANQELKERELQDNMRLKQCEIDINKANTICKGINDKIGDIDTTNLFKEKRELEKQYTSLTLEKQSLQGRLRELGTQIEELKKELQEEPLKHAHKNYRDKFIQLRTTELVSDDLNKYYKALDTAIMKYHSLKMTEINKIIRELWRKTYRGNDIDYIEICSDQPETSTGTDSRKVYHYRVVMVNRDIRIDMRGRCSAGQKVLASLIIRLALAETFCFNCGILALDEPTTNLDRENIESLAKALSDIVTTRAQQRNFQLVVITHDEDFIDMLGRASEVDYFYKVSKDQNCCSRINKCDFAALQG